MVSTSISSETETVNGRSFVASLYRVMHKEWTFPYRRRRSRHKSDWRMSAASQGNPGQLEFAIGRIESVRSPRLGTAGMSTGNVSMGVETTHSVACRLSGQSGLRCCYLGLQKAVVRVVRPTDLILCADHG